MRFEAKDVGPLRGPFRTGQSKDGHDVFDAFGNCVGAIKGSAMTFAPYGFKVTRSPDAVWVVFELFSTLTRAGVTKFVFEDVNFNRAETDLDRVKKRVMTVDGYMGICFGLLDFTEGQGKLDV